jgi:glycosyltransferase involved in cell wall biosynthesis
MSLESCPLVSIIINNYNYASFLRTSIDSALGQTYSNIEVVVVDDGSTDHSLEIIRSYKNCIIPVLKKNGGQASSINAGVQASSGSILCFLDADDIFYPRKVEKVIKIFSMIGAQSKNILLNNFLEVIDKDRVLLKVDLVKEILSDPGEWRFLKELSGSPLFFDGQLNKVSTPEQAYSFADKYRFLPYLGVQTSGITMTKLLANKVFPLPEGGIRISADVFLVKAASLHGTIYSTNHVLTQYRIHGNNHWYGRKDKSDFNKTKHFFLELNNFLNSKLACLGRNPSFSYLNSISAKGYYRYYFGYQCYGHLLILAFHVLSWHVNSTTIYFFAKTVALSTYFRVKCYITNSKSCS